MSDNEYASDTSDDNQSVIDLTVDETCTSAPSASDSSRGVNWVFTCNNWTEDDVVIFKRVVAPKCKYLMYGKEHAPTTGTPHLQGFAMFKSKQSKSVLIKMVPTPTTWKVMKGTPKQNFTYCSKEGDVTEYGTRPEFHDSNGAREKKRWDLILGAAKIGNLDTIPPQVVVCHYNSLMRIQKDYAAMPPDAPDVTGVWIQGPSGCGKSRKARQDYPQAYFKTCNKWWDGYQKQPNVILDDFDPSHAVLGHHLKIWADRYSFLAETKGSAMAIRPQKIVVTTQYRMEDIWKDKETIEALHRRFTVVDMFPPKLFPIFVSPETPAVKRVRFNDHMNQIVQAQEEEEMEVTQDVALPTVIPSNVLIRDGAPTPTFSEYPGKVTPTQPDTADEQ